LKIVEEEGSESPAKLRLSLREISARLFLL
jgi:hypothetical protein